MTGAPIIGCRAAAFVGMFLAARHEEAAPPQLPVCMQKEEVKKRKMAA
ncbi:MAG: hypothetical protein U5K75_02530 [Ahrensia sp.]|nr:hypothetical protein [Ahrensia sp.]